MFKCLCKKKLKNTLLNLFNSLKLQFPFINFANQLSQFIPGCKCNSLIGLQFLSLESTKNK